MLNFTYSCTIIRFGSYRTELIPIDLELSGVILCYLAYESTIAE